MPAREPPLQVVLKVAARCNLNCTYCYVYNKGDNSWKNRPSIMSEEVFDAAIDRVRRHCLRSRQPSVTLTFHGGEPCLVGITRMDRWCHKARSALSGLTKVRFCLQTNGTLLDDAWTSLLRTHQVDLAISLDGPQDINDASRVDHRGRGSYNEIVRGINALRRAGIPLQVLCVIRFEADSLGIHRHFKELGAKTISYLFPDFTHDNIFAIRQRHGPTPCADYLLPILEHWWDSESLETRVVLFWDLARLVLGGEGQVDLFGNRPFGFIFVETDGTIEGLDVLKMCQAGITRTDLNVLRDDFAHLRALQSVQSAAIFGGVALPQACRGCPEETTCAGGYLPHRFSTLRGFDNPSVWCADILKLFSFLRNKLNVTASETILRKRVLQELSAEIRAAASV